jgi:TolB-like protein
MEPGGGVVLYLFGDFTLDTDRRELRRETGPVAIAPQAFDLLEYLVERHDRVISKDDLITHVWGGRIVSESALTTRINAVRTVIGDSGEEQRLIKTLPRKGIRFVAEVQKRQNSPSEPSIPVAAVPASAPLPLANKPSIAVLPFQNLSDDPQQEYFADGVVEDIITGLSRIKWLLVVARNSTFTYKNRTADAKQVGRELGVSYAVEGSVRKSAGRVRITVQLIETVAGTHILAERYDRELKDIFDLQDEITMSVVGAIEPGLRKAEIDRIKRRRPNNLNAYDLVLRSLAHVTGMPKDAVVAIPLLEQALALEPDYGAAHALLMGWTAPTASAS